MIPSKSALLKSLGILLKQHRMAHGFSQEELGALSGLDRTYISGVERGVRNPSLVALVRLSNPLQITVSELLRGLEGEEKPL